MRQTVLGIDARGPHLFNAQTHADVRVDFDGGAVSDGTPANAYGGGLLRLRTAHAALEWDHTQAFFSLDRPIVSPQSPTSLNAVAVPALGWSGNLWTWNPQVGVTQDFSLPGAQRIRVQAALIDVMNPPQIYNGAAASTASITTPTTAELSRWPGAEGRIAFLGGARGLRASNRRWAASLLLIGQSEEIVSIPGQARSTTASLSHARRTDWQRLLGSGTRWTWRWRVQRLCICA